MVGNLLCHSNWFTTLIEGMTEEKAQTGVNGRDNGDDEIIVFELSKIDKFEMSYCTTLKT